jgi:hypothetical protein
MVIPSPGKPFEVFAEEDYICRQWAQQQIGGASPSINFFLQYSKLLFCKHASFHAVILYV